MATKPTVGLRYYNPQTGRYISADPSGYPDGLNDYIHVHNNPVNRIDPLGLDDDDKKVVTIPPPLGFTIPTPAELQAKHDDLLARGLISGKDRNVTTAQDLQDQKTGQAQMDAAHDAYNAGVDARNAAPQPSRINGMSDASYQAGVDTNNGPGSQLILGLAEISVGGPDLGAAEAALNGGRIIEEVGEATKGGTYLLRDPETSKVMRTGRTNDLERRAGEHARDPAHKDLTFEPVNNTDSYPEQRGLEQKLHEQHDPPLNKINPVGPNNPNKDAYKKAADDYLKKQEDSK